MILSTNNNNKTNVYFKNVPRVFKQRLQVTTSFEHKAIIKLIIKTKK